MNLGMPYDYGSVMHYRSIAFSKDFGLSPTITPADPVAAHRMGQRIRFSDVDLAKLNRFYQCPPGYYRGNDLIGKGATIGNTSFGLDNTENADKFDPKINKLESSDAKTDYSTEKSD